MVEISLHFGKSLGLFTVGQSLLSTIESVRTDLPNSKARVLYGEGAKSNASITLLVQGEREDFHMLRFDPALQLLRSVTYNLPSSCKNKSHKIWGTYCLSSKHAISVQSAIDHFGKPKRFLIQSYSNEGKAAYLIYDGTCFVFAFHNPTRRDLSNLKELSEVKSWLVEVRVAPAANCKLLELECGFSLAKRSVLDFQLPEVHCIVHEPSRRVTGLEIAYACNNEGTEDPSPSKCVSFGDKSEDVLANLGSPDHVYYSDQCHCQQMGTLANYWNLLKYSDLHSEYSFCYRHLGIDVLLDAQRNQVSKLVLHTNVPNQFEFGFYSRCFYKLSISQDGMSITSSDDSLLVTPTTNWNVVKSHVKSSHAQHLKVCQYSPSTNTFYPFGNTSLWTLFDQLIVETTDSDHIAKITLLAPNRATILSAKTDKQNVTSTKATLRPVIKEVETTFQVKIHREEKHTTVDSDKDFQDCSEDSFRSAESSIASTQTEAISLSATRDLQEDFTTLTITEKAYFSHNVNAVITNGCNSSASTQNYGSLPDHSPNSLVYEFLEDEEGNGSTSELPSEVATSFSVVHASNTLRISAPTNTSEDGDAFFTEGNAAASTPSPDGREPPETSSFDFISYSEVIESKTALAAESSPLDSDSEKPQEAMSSVEEPLVDSESKTTTQENLKPTSKPDSHPELDSQFQTMSKSSTACVFHYQPKPTVMTASRIMTLSQDVGLFERQSHEATKLNKHLITKAGPKPHSTLKALGRGVPPSKSGDRKHSGKLIIQRRAGSVVSAHKEAKSRLLSHTKSSQQKVKTKYVPKPKEEVGEEEEMKEEEGEMEEGQEERKEEEEEMEEEQEEMKEEEEERKEEEEEMEEGQEEMKEEEEERKESSGQKSESGEMATVESSTQQEEELLTSVLESAEHTLEEKGGASASQNTDIMTTALWKETLDHENNRESEGAAMKDQQHSPSIPQQQSQESDCETTATVADHLPSDVEGTHPTIPNTTVADDLHSDTEGTHPCLGLPLTCSTEKDTNKEANCNQVKSVIATGTAAEGLPLSNQDDKSTTCKVEDPSPRCSPVESKDVEPQPQVSPTTEQCPASAESPLRRCWDEEPFMPGFGPPSMTQDQVLLELISCEHEEVCSRLKTREEGLIHLWQGLLRQGSTMGLDLMMSHDEVLLTDLLSALNKHREVWGLKLTATLLAKIKKLFTSAVKNRHLLVACETVLLIVELHGSKLLKHKTGCLRSSLEEHSQYRECCDTLEEISECTERLILTTQEAAKEEEEEEAEGRLVLQKLKTVRDSVSKIFRKLQME